MDTNTATNEGLCFPVTVAALEKYTWGDKGENV